MTNHNPTFTSSSASASFSETANTTNSSTLHLVSGTMNFTDADHSDTHATAAALHSAVWSGGAVVPAASLADLNAAMSSSILSDSNGSGSLKWSFSAADNDFDFLAKNETLVLTYDVSVTDNHGGTVKQTVTVTITGTDDKPVISLPATASVTEQANHTLSLAPDTAHVALHFTDADLNNTGHTASVTGVSASGVTSGILPGLLGTAELMSFFHVDNVVKNAGSSAGTINTTFSAPDLAFDYLAAGEHLNITYVVQLDDHAGGVSTQNVVVTVIGTNDKPVFISGPETAHLTEGVHVSPAGNLTAHGDLFFTDIDLSDTHTVSTTVSAARSGGGAIPISNADLLAALSTPLEDSTGHLLGEVDWNFALSNSAASFLGAGETLTLNYNITVTDPAHATATQTVTVTILGTNHPVVITSGPESASLSEQADTTGSPALDTTTPVPTGTLSFTDPDLGDTHQVVVSVASATWSGGSSIPAATQADLPAALLTTLHDSTGSGTGGVDWTFSIPDQDLDFLASGETLTVNYNVQVKDASTSATQTVSVTVEGANDAPLVTSGPESASLAELPNTTGSSVLDTTSPVPTGTLNFTDVDLTDTHQVNVSVASAVWSADGFDIPVETQIDLLTALTTTLHDSTGSGSGGVDWAFSIPDRDLDFLGAGETLTVTYGVAVADATANSSQAVTITVTGAQDPLVVNPVTAAVADTANLDAGQFVAIGNVITDVSDSGGDKSATLGVTEVNGQAANVGQDVAGAYGTLFVAADGTYLYTANSALDALQVGQNPTDQFDFTVTDSLGRSESTTLTFNITGADDAPRITAADTSGSMTEDLGPTVIVNGGFETGDLTGWTTSGSHISVDFSAVGGQFGLYAARLGATDSLETLSQDVATTPGQHYTVSFFVTGDVDSSTNSLTATWDGTPILALNDGQSGAFTRYSFDVVGNATHSTTALAFTYHDDGTGLFVDQVAVEAPSGSGTETAAGSISFADVETADTHTASFAPQSGDYVGTFSLDPISEGGRKRVGRLALHGRQFGHPVPVGRPSVDPGLHRIRHRRSRRQCPAGRHHHDQRHQRRADGGQRDRHHRCRPERHRRHSGMGAGRERHRSGHAGHRHGQQHSRKLGRDSGSLRRRFLHRRRNAGRFLYLRLDRRHRGVGARHGDDRQQRHDRHHAHRHQRRRHPDRHQRQRSAQRRRRQRRPDRQLRLAHPDRRHRQRHLRVPAADRRSEHDHRLQQHRRARPHRGLREQFWRRADPGHGRIVDLRNVRRRSVLRQRRGIPLRYRERDALLQRRRDDGVGDRAGASPGRRGPARARPADHLIVVARWS